MYRIQQQLVSWVCANLADIAEIDPANVAPSLAAGSIELNSVNIRTRRLNQILPVHVVSGSIGQLRVSIPWLSRTVQPISVTIENVELNVTMAVQENEVVSSEETLTIEEVIGSHCGALSQNVERTTSDSADSDNDDDFHSCKSDTESVSSGSDSDDDATPTTSGAQGLLRSMVSRVAHYVSPTFFAPRPIKFEARNVQIVLRPHDGCTVGVRIAVGTISALVEPKAEATPNTALRIANVALSDIKVDVLDNHSSLSVVSAARVCVVDTTTSDSLGAVLAKNLRVAMEDNCLKFHLSDSALDKLLQCVRSFVAFRSTPPYARPFLPLLGSRSRWPFTRSAVLAFLSDRRRRWNFNLSHLRAFRVARRHYLDILDRCHRDGKLDDQLRTDLHATERELVYRDVVLALRISTMKKFDRGLYVQAPDARTTAQSIHCILSQLHVALPNSSSCAVVGTTVIVRDGEMTLTIDSFSATIGGGGVSSVGSTPFLTVRKKFDAASWSTVTACEVQPMNGSTNLMGLIRTFHPFAACAAVMSQLQPTPTGEKSPPRKLQRDTFNLLLHKINFSVDSFTGQLEKASACVIAAYDRGGVNTSCVVGCSQASLQHLSAFVVAPFSVRTVDQNRVQVSSIAVNVSQLVLTECSVAMKAITNILGPSPQSMPVPNSLTPAATSLQSVLGMQRQGGKTIASIEIASIEVVIQPMNIKADVMQLHCGLRRDCFLIDMKECSTQISGEHTLACSASQVHALCCKFCEGDPRSAVKMSMESLSVTLDASHLVAMDSCLLGLCDGDIALETPHVVLAEGIVVNPLKFAATRVRGAVPTETHPFHASNVSLLLNIERVQLPAVLSHRSIGHLGGFVRETVVPMAQKLMSVSAQRLFMSGLSNVVVHLTASGSDDVPAEVVITDGSDGSDVRKVFVAISQRHPKEMASVHHSPKGSMITIVNHCHALAVEVTVSSLHVLVAPDLTPTQWIALFVDSARYVQPMSVLDYWTDDAVVEILPPDRSFHCSKFIVDFTGDNIAQLNERNFAECIVEKCHIQHSNRANETPATALSLHIARLRLHTQLVDQRKLFASIECWSALLPARECDNVTITSSLSGRQWSQQKGGPITIEAPLTIVVLEDCEFFCVDPIVVQTETVCIFRRCTFHCHNGEPVRLNDKDRSILEDCHVLSSPQETLDLSNVGKLPKVTLGGDQILLSVAFLSGDTIRLSASDCSSQVVVGGPVYLRTQTSAFLQCGQQQFTLFQDSTCTLDGILGVAQRHIRLSSHLGIGTVRVPVHLLAKMTANIADAAGTGDHRKQSHVKGTTANPIRLEQWTWAVDVSAPHNISLCREDGNALVSLASSQLYLQSQRLSKGARVDSSCAWRLSLKIFDPAVGTITDVTEDALQVSLSATYDKEACNVNVSIMPCSIKITDSTARVVSGIALISRSRQGGPSLVISNELGTPVQVRVPLGETEWLSQEFCDTAEADVRVISSISLRVCNFAQNFIPVSNWENHYNADCGFPQRTCDIFVVGGLTVRISLNTLDDLRQVLRIHTLVAISNRLPDQALRLCGGIDLSSSVGPVVVKSGAVRHVPLYLVDDGQFYATVVHHDRTDAKLEFNGSPRSIAQRCENEGATNLGQRHEVVLSDAPVHIIDSSISSVHHANAVSTISVHPGLPSLVNHLPFDVTLVVLDSDSILLESVPMGSGACCHLYNLCSNGLPAFCIVEASCLGGTFISSESVSIDASITGEELCVMMKSSERPGHFFELALLPFVGEDGCVLSLTCTTGFVVYNKLGADAVIASDLGFPLGTCGDRSIPSHTQREGFGLLPSNTALIIDVGHASGEFTVDLGSMTNQTIVCSNTPHCGACLFLVPRPPCLLGEQHLTNGEWRREVLKRSWKGWDLTPPLTVRNFTPHVIAIKHFAAHAGHMKDTLLVQELELKSNSEVLVTKLALSDFCDLFSFATGGHEAIAVPFAIMPESCDTIHVTLGSCVIQVRVVKGIPCSTAIMTITMSTPPVVVVNATPISFDGFPSMVVSPFTPSPRIGSIALNTQGKTDTCILEVGECCELTNARDVCAQVKKIADRVWVFLTTSRCSTGAQPKRPATPITLNLNLSRHFLTLVTSGRDVVCAGFEGVNLWVKESSNRWTMQGSVSDFELRNLIESYSVLRPLRADLTLQDVSVTNSQVSIRSVRANVTRIELKISDVLLAELAQFRERLSTMSGIARSVGMEDTHPTHWTVQVQSIAIAELHMVISWDRNGDADQGKLLRRLTGLLNLVGSVSCMTLTLPMFQADYCDPTNALEITAAVTKHYLNAVLLQVGRFFASLKAFGSPLAWASGLVSGVHSAIASDAVRRAISSPFSLFSTSSVDVLPQIASTPEPAQRGNWVCVHCSKFYDCVVNKVELPELLSRFGAAAIGHHCSQWERLKILRVVEAEPAMFFAVLSINSVIDADPTRREDLAPPPKDITADLAANYPPNVLYSACLVGLLPPFYDPWWQQVQRKWRT